MKKHRFYFNAEDLTYRIIRPKYWLRAIKFAGGTFSVLLVISLVIAATFKQQNTPDQDALQRQVSFYKSKLNNLNLKIEKLNASLNELQIKDQRLYSIIFETSPEIDSANTSDVRKNVPIDDKIDLLSTQVEDVSKSYSELLKLAIEKKYLLANIPAIEPISKRDLNEIASGFGMRLHPVYKTMKMHEGLDFVASPGTDIYCTGDGVVEKVDYDGAGFGKHVIVNHGFGYKTIYGHMSKQLVHVGQKVKRGQVIGKVGSTGLSVGPHLHYEVVKNGKKVNPINYFHNDLKADEYEKIIKLANRPKQSFD